MYSALLTPEETAQVLNVSRDRVYRMAREGLLPVVKVGRLLRFDKEQLRKWIESGGKSFEAGWRKSVAN